MSLWISLHGPDEEKWTCHHCDTVKTNKVEHYDRNITHNLNTMADKAGIYEAIWRPKEKNYKLAMDLIEPLKKGLKNLVEKPDYFKEFNPDNGWGDYEGLLSVVQEYLDACIEYPMSEIHANG